MKNFKLVLAAILTYSLLTFTSFAAMVDLNISKIDSSKKDKMIISLDNQIDTKTNELKGDISVFKDLEVKKISKFSNDTFNVNIELSEALKPNTSYDILSFDGVTGNMDFTTEDNISENVYENNFFDDGIESITIANPYNIVVTYKEEVKTLEEDIIIKVLKETKISSLNLDSENPDKIIATFEKGLESKTNYIVMAYTIETDESDEYTFLNPIFDFKSIDYEELEKKEADNKNEKENLIKEITSDDVIKDIEKTIEDDIEPMLSGEIEDVALNSAETPDTGAETNVLIIMTFIITSIVFLRKKYAK